jgi:hypothetical protein
LSPTPLHAFTGPELKQGIAAVKERRKPVFPTHSAFWLEADREMS